MLKLLGAAFNNKDKKKGQHDTLQVALQEAFGYTIRFLDTSNTCYQSFCDAAIEIITHLDFYCTFLEYVHDLKEKRSFTNLEKNAFDGLDDIPTLTKMCVLILYTLSVSYLYMHIIRRSPNTNMLDLCSTHSNLADFIQKVIKSPSLLILLDTGRA